MSAEKPYQGIDTTWRRPRNGENAESRGSWDEFTAGARRVGHLVRKEFIQTVRNRQNFRMLIFAPIFQLLLLGYASRLDVQNVPTAVVDLDRTTMSRNLIDAFSRSGYFTITHRPSSYKDVDRLLDSGEISCAILIPSELERRIKGDRTAEVGVLIDGVDTTTASTVSGYAEAILKRFSIETMEDRIKRARGSRYANRQPDIQIPTITTRSRAWFNPNLDSKEFFVPAILALVLTFIGLTSTSMALVREKERGTIEQLMVTPISSFEMIVGKALPCLIIALVNFVCMTLITVFWFAPPFRGSMVFFCFCSLIHIFTCLGLGMFVSSFCRTQQQAMLTSFMILQPSVLLSGFMFPIENMPQVIQYVTYLNPLRYFLLILREIFLKGMGWEVLWPQIIPLAAMAVTFLTLASFTLKKKID
ncbi:MAG: ABC transporter permease [Pseudomonadota bacterium]